MKKFTWSDAKGKPGKQSDQRADRKSGGHKNTGRPENVSSSVEGSIDHARIVRALESMPKSSGSMREVEFVLDIKAPDQRRSFKRMVTSMLASGELSQRGKYLTLSKGRHKEESGKRHSGSHRHARGSGATPGDRAGGRTWTGKLSAHPDGYGFVAVPGRKEDLFLPQNEMKGLMHGDTVEVRAVNYRGRESAELVRIVEEGYNIIIGQFLIRGGVGMVEPRSRKVPQSILVAAKDARGAHDGDWVQVEIQRGTTPLRGRVLQGLSGLLKPSGLIDLIIAEQQLPGEFPDAVMEAANSMPQSVSQAEAATRKDLRHLSFVTIDGEDAKDFDDAVCVMPRGDGFEVWVAIADVAHYVRPNTALDKEAFERSTSFYFPDRVIPMLPEALSNGLCSLRPNVDRLTMAVRMRFDCYGRGRAAQVYDAVIHSRARLTYTQVAAWLEHGDAGAKDCPIQQPEIQQMLSDASRLLQLQEKNRETRGALGLDLPEVRPVVINDEISSLEVSERNIAHRLIEELMLSANVAVAHYFEAHNSPLLYRVHPKPEREAIDKVNDFLAPFGATIKQHHTSGVRPLDIQKILHNCEEKPYGHVLHRLILRSMQQAKYSPNNEGHFGLAYESYCHFTSPIRRYADLTVHRRLKALIRKEDPNRVQPANTLAAVGEHVSIQERKQVRSEWDVEAMLGALYHVRDVGKTFKAIVSGITRRRVFVEIESSLAEASIAVDELGSMFVLDEKNHRLVARRGGYMINLGDELDIEITSTDPVRGVINIALVTPEKPQA
ncbi:MAG: ribonuclease R [Mariprofundaceae bacterium]|nr:ribonuclease R [Mariprofundaceae bacterium]